MRAALAWLSYRLPLQKICTTDWLREQTGDRSAYVVGHGIDLDVFQPPCPSRTPGASAWSSGPSGGFGEAKGYPDFLRALDLLPGRPADRDPDRRAGRRRACPERFPSTVEHPRPEREMAEFYGRCDLFVFSSRGEGFGLPGPGGDGGRLPRRHDRFRRRASVRDATARTA